MWIRLGLIDNNSVIEIGNPIGNISKQRNDLYEMRIVDVLRLISDLMIVNMPTGTEERDRNAVACILVMITSAVVLLRMSGGVELVVEVERTGVCLVHSLDEIAKGEEA